MTAAMPQRVDGRACAAVDDTAAAPQTAHGWSATRVRAEAPLMVAYAVDAMQLSLPNAAMYIVLYHSLVRVSM